MTYDDPFRCFVPYPDAPVKHSPTGPLAGLTLAVKDLFDVKGYPTGAGSPIVLAQSGIKAKTAPIVKDLLDAGARFIGKTHTDELAFSRPALARIGEADGILKANGAVRFVSFVLLQKTEIVFGFVRCRLSLFEPWSLVDEFADRSFIEDGLDAIDAFLIFGGDDEVTAFADPFDQDVFFPRRERDPRSNQKDRIEMIEIFDREKRSSP